MVSLLPWHHHSWQRLIHRHRLGRLPHALLLVGAVGQGKGVLAHYFAQALLCRSLDSSGTPCGTCGGCRRFLAETHPDFLRIQPERETKADSGDEEGAKEESSGKTAIKGSRWIKVEQIRALGEWISLRPHYGGRKVAILNPAEQMNSSAANGLLKTLEEPPGDAVLILLTPAPTQLPITIRSRCQTVILPPVSPAQGVPWLLAQGVADPALATLAFNLAEGAPLAALELAKGDVLSRRRALFGELEGVVSGRLSPLAVAQNWIPLLAETLALQWSWLADMIRLLSAPGTRAVVNTDLADGLARLARQLGLERLYGLLDRVTEARRLVQGSSNPNPQLLLEDLLIPWRGQG